jgi:hypothetical protein
MPITTTPSGGAQGEFSTYTPIYSTTLSSATASITLSNIPTTFTDLVMVTNFGTSTNGPMTIQVNDSATGYSRTCMYGDGSVAASFRETSQTYLNTANGYNALTGVDTTYFMNYSNPNVYKPILNKNGNVSGTAAVNANTWQNFSPITSIKVYNANGYNLISGSSVTLYGIKAAAPAPKATGGDVITTDGIYWYHAFKTTGVFSLTSSVSSLTADVLVVAVGAGGGQGGDGGGGAGGISYQSGRSLSATNYTVTVGAGGVSVGNYGFAGNNSVFDTITSNGGGKPGNEGETGGAGRSGGGGGGPSLSGAASNQGNTGGATGYGFAGGNANGYSGGGGGGAGASGASASTSNAGGAGGNGLNTWSSWASATGTGASGYYAGGGGGNSNNDTPKAGGLGGGGTGGRYSNNTAPTAGVTNTGSGGGGGNFGNTKSGGSGIIIVRYAV